MEKFSNIQTFTNYYDNDNKIDGLLEELFLDEKLGYFNYNGKKYRFSPFSDYKLQEFDKGLLGSEEAVNQSLFRTLKLACSMDFVYPRVAIGNSLFGVFDPLILFQKNGEDNVVDYSRNLVMKKEDYYELFHYEELNVVDKVELYNIYSFITEFNDYSHIYEYLLFTKEIFRDLFKKEEFKFLASKYDEMGIHMRNYPLFAYNHDVLFFRNEDATMGKYAKLIIELDEFTENPTKQTEHIFYNLQRGQYQLEDKEFGFFTFGLLSDMFQDPTMKRILLSEERYGMCHTYANVVASSLKEVDKNHAYVVAGGFKENEIDYLHHSWVEIDNKNVVMDFNHNLVMNRDKYYKLFGIEVISKTFISEMEKIIKIIRTDNDLKLSFMELNYFGKEIMRDLEKSQNILVKR